MILEKKTKGRGTWHHGKKRKKEDRKERERGRKEGGRERERERENKTSLFKVPSGSKRKLLGLSLGVRK
jgi:hypothetical protein